jgi:hypothetical protein
MDCVPVPAKAVVRLACPSLSPTVLNTTVPFLVNVTEPVGVPPNCDVTLAVKVTDCPASDGLGDETREVAVLAGFTTSFKAGEVLAK